MEKSVAKDAEGLAVRDVQKIIGDYFIDQDPRVRTAAIKAMVNMIMETKWGEFCLFFICLFKFVAKYCLRYILNFSRIHLMYTFQEDVGGITEIKGAHFCMTLCFSLVFSGSFHLCF